METKIKTIKVVKPTGQSMTLEYVTDAARYSGIRVYAVGTTTYYDGDQFDRLLADQIAKGATVEQVA